VYHQFPEIHQTHGVHAGVGLRSERARQADIAIEHRFSPAMHWQVTLYRRDDDRFLRLADSNFRIVNRRLVEPSGTGPWRNALSGTSTGAEWLLQRDSALGLSGWLSYSYGRSRYHDVVTGEDFHGDFDQRHTVNTFVQYAISSRTSASAKFRYGSNFPMPGYWSQQNGLLLVGERLNEARMPAYSRLDLRVNRVFNYTKRRLTLFAEVMNALDRHNTRFRSPSINRRTGEVVEYLQDLFPLLPSAGILVEF
jgi:outer membrane receptor for ferrienterochelin and colicin